MRIVRHVRGEDHPPIRVIYDGMSLNRDRPLYEELDEDPGPWFGVEVTSEAAYRSPMEDGDPSETVRVTLFYSTWFIVFGAPVPLSSLLEGHTIDLWSFRSSQEAAPDALLYPCSTSDLLIRLLEIAITRILDTEATVRFFFDRENGDAFKVKVQIGEHSFEENLEFDDTFVRT